jgi:hypothetical protein
MLTQRVADELDDVRRRILTTFQSVYTTFGVSLS